MRGGVTGTLNTSFTYDPNGNQLTGNGRTIVYTSFNKPKTTTQNGKTVSYVYDANHRRLSKTTSGKTTTYVNAYYQRDTVGTTVDHQYTIYAGTTSVAQLRSQAIAPPPKITGVWPGSGIAGSAVFVFGDGFIAGTKVSIGTTPVTAVQLLGKDFLVFFVPSGNPKGTVSVINSQGSASSTQAFGTPVTGLSLTGVWPGQGNTGQFIFLFGSGFSTGTKVNFNGTAAPMVHILSPELLVVVVPKGATDGPIRVTNTQGTVSSSAFRVASSTGLKLYYLHTDHLGSIDTITDDTGQVIQRLSYDAHGKRRNKNGTDATIPITSQITKGYTRHEHDDEVNLIHMRAREYDPILGRFITPDTIIPGALNSQNYNRYSYVNNNPLSFTDPSGHSRLSKGLRRAVKSFTNAHKDVIDWHSRAVEKVKNNQYVRTAVAIAAAYYTGNMFNSAFLGGFVGGGIAGGNAKSAFYGGLTGAAFGFVGDLSLPYGQNIAAHAFTGGVTSELAGGDFRSGAIGAGFGAFASPVIQYAPGGAYGRVLAAGLIGGGAADLAGGDFGNGFATAAFGRLFNHEGPDHQYKTKEEGGKTYTLRYHRCANTDCLLYGANLDTSDAGTQAYLQASEGQGLRALGTAASAVAFMSPLGVAGRVANIIALTTDVASFSFFQDRTAAASLMIGQSAEVSAAGFGVSAGAVSRIGTGSSLIFDYLNNR